MKLYVDDEPMLLSVSDIEDYERTLDFRNGLLRREIIWRTPGGKRVLVSSVRMVSFTQRHLAIMTFEVTMLDDDAPVVISSQTLNRQDGRDEYHVRSAAMGGGDPRQAEAFHERVLEPQSHWWHDKRIIQSWRCVNSRMTIAVGSDHDISTDNPYRVYTSAEEDTAKMVYRVQARAGVPIRVTKTVAYHTSRGVPTRELVDRCRRTLDRVLEYGTDIEFDAQRRWLDAYWERSDVVVHGQPALQQAIRWNLFQVAQAAARAEQSGVPAKGVTGSGYSGHYFWDDRDLRRCRSSPTPRRRWPAARSGSATTCCPRPGAGPLTWLRAGRCSPGARSTARRPRPTTPPAPRSTTSTPTSSTR